MNELVFLKNEQPVTSSLQVAENFDKDHKHILESIENLTVENSAVKNMFREGTYKNSRGRLYRMFYMTKDGFTLLAMGFTGKKATHFKIQYINAFNKMEEQIMTQKELAELIHANPQQLNRAIKGDMTPKSRELREQVARVLNL